MTMTIAAPAAIHHFVAAAAHRRSSACPVCRVPHVSQPKGYAVFIAGTLSYLCPTCLGQSDLHDLVEIADKLKDAPPVNGWALTAAPCPNTNCSCEDGFSQVVDGRGELRLAAFGPSVRQPRGLCRFCISERPELEPLAKLLDAHYGTSPASRPAPPPKPEPLTAEQVNLRMIADALEGFDIHTGEGRHQRTRAATGIERAERLASGFASLGFTFKRPSTERRVPFMPGNFPAR